MYLLKIPYSLAVLYLVSTQVSNTVFIKELKLEVDTYEVTQSDFDAYLITIPESTLIKKEKQGYFFNYDQNVWVLESVPEIKQSDNSYPATLVTYEQACEYCKYKGGRLPTNEEWEYYSGENIIKGNVWHGLFPYKDYGNDGYKATYAPIGQFAVNDFGLYDIYGNVWEFTQVDNDQLFLRGGSYLCDFSMCTNAKRKGLQSFKKNKAQENVGFRCVYDRSD